MNDPHREAELIRRQGSFQVEPAWYLEDRLVPSEESEGQEARPLVLALHGMGQDALRMKTDLRNQLDERFLVLYADGPLPYEVKEESGARHEGHAWYIYTGEQERFLSSALRSEQYLMTLIDQIGQERAIDPRRIYLAGYSQGGYLAGIMALRRPDLFAGVAAINSRVKNEVPEDRHSAGGTLPVLVLHGEKDRFIPIEAAEQSAKTLESRGFPVTFQGFPSGHAFSEEEATAVADWLLATDDARAAKIS